MTKYKIGWLKKGLYSVMELKEDGDEINIEVIFKGTISEVEAFVKEKRNGAK